MTDDDLKPLTELELADMERLAGFDIGVHAEEGDAERLRSMVFEIRMHRDAMAPAMLRATRLYTDELGALRKRVAEIEAALAARNLSAGDLWRAAGCPPGEIEDSPAARYRLFVALREWLVTADICLDCGDHTPGSTCQCENDE